MTDERKGGPMIPEMAEACVKRIKASTDPDFVMRDEIERVLYMMQEDSDSRAARARADALEEAAKVADLYDVPSEPRTEAEQAAHNIAERVRALAR